MFVVGGGVGGKLCYASVYVVQHANTLKSRYFTDRDGADRKPERYSLDRASTLTSNPCMMIDDGTSKSAFRFVVGRFLFAGGCSLLEYENFLVAAGGALTSRELIPEYNGSRRSIRPQFFSSSVPSVCSWA